MRSGSGGSTSILFDALTSDVENRRQPQHTPQFLPPGDELLIIVESRPNPQPPSRSGKGRRKRDSPLPTSGRGRGGVLRGTPRTDALPLTASWFRPVWGRHHARSCRRCDVRLERRQDSVCHGRQGRTGRAHPRLDGRFQHVGPGSFGNTKLEAGRRVPADRHRLPGARQERQAARSRKVRPRNGGRRGAAARSPQDRKGPLDRLLERRVHRRQGGRDASRARPQHRLRRASAAHRHRNRPWPRRRNRPAIRKPRSFAKAVDEGKDLGCTSWR